ncbi:MAG: hypothetical protein A6F72_05680 [Cycloclasticus sp. symbiont of Poecilosclerida sp. N]|nr:MAG: hypothetical protein A6F72_05680 [Cycloclasticus sp. symbiont of Poecilosclerida sp. N]
MDDITATIRKACIRGAKSTNLERSKFYFEFQIREALLMFYEQNNISTFKQIFIDQFEFAVNT